MRLETKDDVRKLLNDYITSDIKGVYLYTVEHESVNRIIDDIWKEHPDNYVLFHFDHAKGLTTERKFRPYQIMKGRDELKSIDKVFELLNSWIDQSKIVPGVIFEEINEFLENDVNFKRIFYNGIVSLAHKGFYFYIVSSKATIPDVIEKKVFYIDVPLPSNDEIERMLDEKIRKYNIAISSEYIKDKAVNALHGLTEEETLGLINLIIADGVINDDDVITIGNIKKQIIKKGGVLEFVITDENMNAVGGFDRLKSWIRKKKKIVDNLDSAKRFGVDVPKGIMLFGMPGCGKSLCAKALATEFGVPLLKLDMGMILGPYVGQSEENIRKAIKQSESIAPCVLWIDEIEKAFSGIGGSGGSAEVTTRIFGTLLTWMQERSRMVFVVATANDITSMPPEFLRRGRFDEVFFVDFPDIDERKEIIKIHLKKRKKEEWINKIDIDKMAKETEEFSGADLEAIVSSIVEEAFVNDWKEPVKEYVDNVVKEFKPLSHTMKDKIDQIKELYKKYNFINVSSRKK